MSWILLTPLIAFGVILVAVLGLAFAMSRLAFKKQGTGNGGAKPYACGEDIPSHMLQPDYSQFFPFVFFFTMLHVAVLMIVTMPAATAATLVLAILYVFGGSVALSVLTKR